MSQSPQNRQASLPSRRIALDREISIQVPAFDSFITEYSANISTTGMFIKSEKPLPPDTEIAVEFKIADDWKLIRGEATVVWCRYRAEGPDQPAGMGVHFTDLEPQSRRLISWIIEKHIREGGKPFDLDSLRGVPPEAMTEPPAAAEAEAPAAPPGPKPKRPTQRPAARTKRAARPARPQAGAQSAGLRFGPLIAAGLVVTALLFGLFWLSERSAQEAANPELRPDPSAVGETAAEQAGAEAPAGPGAAPDQLDGGAAAADPVQVAESDPAPARGPAEAFTTRRPGASPSPEQSDRSSDRTAAADPPTSSSPPTSLRSDDNPTRATLVFLEVAGRTVEGWAEAWSEQDVDTYLAYYSRNFEPAGGQSLRAWAANRRERLLAPDFIEVEVSDLRAELLSESRGRAEFTQRYRSNTYSDTVRKVLELVREDARWKILEEKTVG